MIEFLESRLLASASIVKAIGHGVLVRGDSAANDRIRVSISDDATPSLRISIEGRADELFALRNIRTVRIDAGGGDDTVTIDLFGDPAARIHVFANGGAGSDTIRGGDGRDSLNGNGGNDFIDGRAGRDILRGGAGSDYLDGGSDLVQDQLFGGSGFDTAEFSAADQIVLGGGANRVIDQRSEVDPPAP